MKHRTLVGGTGYDIRKGRILVGGTGYDIKKGRTLVNGTGYDIPFLRKVVIEGVASRRSAYVAIDGTTYMNNTTAGNHQNPTARYDLELEPGTMIEVQDSYGVYFNGERVAEGGGSLATSTYSFEVTDDTTIVWASEDNGYSTYGTYITTG